jgi:adenylate kinase
MRIIVLGISGVGKTTACRAFVARNPEFLHVTASELIRKATGARLEELRTANAEQILANQLVLQQALQTELQKQKAPNVLIDGQCVLDNGREIVVIPADLIAPLRPTGFILLEGRPEEILRRRRNDARRPLLRTTEEIFTQLEMNRVTVRHYAAFLGVPFVIAEAVDGFSLDHQVAQLS